MHKCSLSLRPRSRLWLVALWGLSCISCMLGAEESMLPPKMPAPAYPISYAPASVESVASVLGRILGYLEQTSPILVRDEATGAWVSDLHHLPDKVRMERGAFPIVSYEWGVTYAGMLAASGVIKEPRYATFVASRLEAIRLMADYYRTRPAMTLPHRYPMRSVVAPKALDDSGSMAAAMIKAERAGVVIGLRPMIDRFLRHISDEQKRLPDGTLARDRPMANSLWLDDLYMSVPALAQMGLLTGESRYFDDAAKQVLQISERLYLREKQLFRHGWVEGMEVHPSFLWGRANGWAAVTLVELLSVLPENHPKRAELLGLFQAFAQGLARTQGLNGRWHQLLDRPETYEETSCTAMFVYALARGINRGWIDPLSYGPLVEIGWNAVAQQVNGEGQVMGTCIGTGMAWEPVFYAHRPVSVYAAHGYGPVLLAGAEMITLRQGVGARANLHDEGLHYGETPKGHW